ncbi:MAG: uracil-DNA glycosylase [Maribacter sp.]|jgi:uracil-DNA glycosylase
MGTKITDIEIEESWENVLKYEFQQPYFAAIKQALVDEKEAENVVYPPDNLIFNAFNITAFNDVKVVIIGQDPYHNPSEAMGLSFSVPKGMKVPPSLKRIYKEIAADIENFEIPSHGDLTFWAEQGVLLLNAMLTVQHKKAGSHKKIGWQSFTNAVIKKISDEKEGVVFLLWGNFAKKKGELIDNNKHHILSSPHPSPLAGSGFFGNKHFISTNELLEKQGKKSINWQV